MLARTKQPTEDAKLIRQTANYDVWDTGGGEQRMLPVPFGTGVNEVVIYPSVRQSEIADSRPQEADKH